VNIGSEVKKRREAFGFSTSQLAALAFMEPARLESIEAGTVPSTYELASLADALAIDPSALRTGNTDDPYRSVVRFRSAQNTANKSRLLSPSDLRLLARAAEAGRITAWLKESLKVPASPLLAARQVRGVDNQSSPWEQGYQLGAHARLRLAPTPPKRLGSIQEFLEKAGVHVAFVAFESSHIEAASLFEPQASPVVLLNTSSPRNQFALPRRAILAHELCHLLHDGGQRNLLTQVSWQDDNSATEQRANGFAPSFLAPKKWVKVRAKEPRAIAEEIAMAWGLSFEGAAWHAKNLKLISPEIAGELLRMPEKPRMPVETEPDLARTPPESLGLEVEPSLLAKGLLSELALRACAEGLIGKHRAAEILTIQ
jgi:Zn-dependent peptidase ImmA (M78 family)